MNCPTKEMRRLEFPLSPWFLQNPRAVNRLHQISLSKCSRLSTSTFKMGNPKEKPHHNSNKKNGFMKSIWAALGLRYSDTCLPALGCDVASPWGVSFLIPWNSFQNILGTAPSLPYNGCVTLTLSGVGSPWISAEQIQVAGLQLVVDSRELILVLGTATLPLLQ